MGIVYEALDPSLRRRVAIKVVRGREHETEAISRLHREAAIAAQLRHPNIVSVHEVGMAQDASGHPVHFIVMDFVDGGTLADLLSQGDKSRAELLRIFEAIAQAVAYAHARGVVHRDLKPANILIDGSGRVLLTDFGLACARQFTTRLTQSHAQIGTPQYMAPEQVEGKRGCIDKRTDVWGLGTILYEMLTGHPPFREMTVGRLYHKILNQDAPRPMAGGRPVEPDLEVLCLKALALEQNRRYPSAAELAEDFGRFLRREPIQARPPSWGYTVRRGLRRLGRGVWVGLVAAVVLASVTGILVVRAGNSKKVRRYKEMARQAMERGEWERVSVCAITQGASVTLVDVFPVSVSPRV